MSAVQQSDSVRHRETSFFLNILFHYGLSQDIEYSSLFIHPTYKSLHPLIPNTQSGFPPLPSPLEAASLFSDYEFVSVLHL